MAEARKAARLKGEWSAMPKITPGYVQDFIAKWPLWMNLDDPTFKDPAKVREVANQRLQNQISLCARFSRYYKNMFSEQKIDPASIRTVEDLDLLPVTYKADYMKDPLAFKLEMDQPGLESLIYDIMYTTGSTTGRPSPFFNTAYDIYRIYLTLMRGAKIQFLTPDDVQVNLFPLSPVPHIGFARMRDISTLVGANSLVAAVGTPLPGAPVNRSMDQAIELVEQKQATYLIGISSYIRRFLMRAQEMGKDFSRVRKVVLGGEAAPLGLRSDIRERLRSLGSKDPMINNDYGFTEIQSALCECGELGGCHNPSPDLNYLEVVDEKTGKRLPDGELGLLCLTHLDRRGTVLLRYAIGDIAALTHEPCPHCGRTSQRVIVKAGSTYGTRTKELIKFKGTLINPEHIRDAVVNTQGVQEYQIVFTKEDDRDPYSLDRLVVRLACMPGANADQVAADVVTRVRDVAEMRPVVEFAPPDELYNPNTTLKATRIVDKRPTE